MTGRSRAVLAALAALLLTAAAGARFAGGSGAGGPAPPPPPGEMARMKALIESGELDAARARLEELVALHPEWGRAHLLLGIVELRSDRFERARRLLERAAALDPDERSSRLFLGWACFYLGDLDAAEAAVGEFLRRVPRHAEAHYALGRIAFERDDVDAARRELGASAALAAAEGDRLVEGRARGRLVDLWLRLGDPAAALREAEAAAKLLPESWEIAFKLALSRERGGDVEGARRARERSDELRQQQAPGAGMD